ncbi:hypothetical protein ACQEU5_20370 [Marinactinospora thermotolerans]|uniref:Uncharacterized protein n=1 Tax=Marinactinospora thermotolerans DSM 45154 TaxID=1122192 RepID=A0A1T4PTL1_9ACTN|nr:hypothetical protein [Marinactinospora thermotolerans]SJZ94873.1 hypothetical protein SAMN02745673_01994 [Marinactinospora thermotolerans DSM 45154]
MIRPVTFEPLAQRQIRALAPPDRAALSEVLLDLAGAADPMTVVDPYLPGGIGPLPFHGVVLTDSAEAVVTLYLDHVRVVAVRPRHCPLP